MRLHGHKGYLLTFNCKAMKIILYLDGQKWKEEKVMPEKVEEITDKFKRIAARLGRDYEIYLIAKSKANNKIKSLNYHECKILEENKVIVRPPAKYSNKSPMGIATEFQK